MSICYSISVDGAIAQGGYTLSSVIKEKYRFISIARFLDDQVFETLQFDTLEEVPSYAALSYPWRNLSVLDPKAPPERAFKIKDIPNEPATTVSVLQAVCIAARQQHCTYLWMDKLCLRQDDSEMGRADRAWQMKRMYDVYHDCKICLVAAGGMVRLPRLAEKTVWIDRAWTLQEALAPKEVACLFVWNSGDKVISGGNMQGPVAQVAPGIGMADLRFLLVANLHADVPQTTKGKDWRGNSIDVAILPSDPDSQVWFLGNRGVDDWPIRALIGALERPNPTEAVVETTAAEAELSSRRVGIWRCITMRSATYAEDFVFATMGIFGVSVDPLIDPKTGNIRAAGYPENEIQELLGEHVKALSGIGARADWFAVAPELGPARETSALPIVPDINYTPDKNGRAASATVKGLLNYWDGFNWYLADALKYTVDAPNGIKVTAPAHEILLPGVGSSGPSLTRIYDGLTFDLANGANDGKQYAIVIGKKDRYRDGSVPPVVDETDVILLMLVEYIDFTQQRYKNVGYAWTQEKVVNGWPAKTFGIGLRGG